MKYFIDTEFAETGGLPSPTIDLISIGIVAEDGREYYAESSEFSVGNCNQWVSENVLPLLGPMDERKARNTIRDEITAFVGGDILAEFWAYYADYDWVVFCWLWGGMTDLPNGFPMICMDLQQAWIREGRPEIKPPDPIGEHNALVDARWNEQLFRALHTHVSLTDGYAIPTDSEGKPFVVGPQIAATKEQL
jgi:hypothetical protein